MLSKQLNLLILNGFSPKRSDQTIAWHKILSAALPQHTAGSTFWAKQGVGGASQPIRSQIGLSLGLVRRRRK
jgi:hypothetical protein